MFQRAVLHLDLDAFFASVECRNNNALRGRPLLIGSVGGRSVVASCSPEARRYGIWAGMPMATALLRCPDATVIRGDYEQYHQESAVITAMVAEESPLFEKAALDAFYIDLTGVDRYVGCWQWSQALRARIQRETGLPLSVGLAVNKLVSKVGAHTAKPNGERCVAAGTEQDFLAPLPVGSLPAVGPVTTRRLSLLGVHTVGHLHEIPPVLLRREFGQPGLTLWRKAQGEDNSPVVPYHDEQALRAEYRFEEDTINLQLLQAELARLIMTLAFDLRQRQKVAACMTLKIRYADSNTYSRSVKLAPTASDRTLLSHAQELFTKLFQRRQSIRLLGLRLDHLSSGYTQLNLFDDQPQENQLLKTMDGIRQRFGKYLLERW